MMGPIKPFNSMQGIAGVLEDFGVNVASGAPLSGYLAGRKRGGLCVQTLEDHFSEMFHVKHAIACNSATSGLLAAAFAVGLKPGDQFACPAMTMSATAAAPMFTGATPFFTDVEDKTFGLALGPMPDETKAIFSVNLFGHPSPLGRNEWDKSCGTYFIEDNSQSPFATVHGRYCGTMGHIGVFSFNVHKHLQCGEGGMMVTDDDALADRLRAFINHGEHVAEIIGLNLRMPEVSAAIAIAQMKRANEIMQSRIEQAEEIIGAIGKIPGIRPPMVRDGCSHVYYTIPFLIDGADMRVGTGDSDVNVYLSEPRARFCASLKAAGVPIVRGYVPPLYRLPAFKAYARPCPVAEGLHYERLFYIENCRYSFSPEQIKLIGEAFRKAADDRDRR